MHARRWVRMGKGGREGGREREEGSAPIASAISALHFHAPHPQHLRDLRAQGLGCNQRRFVPSALPGTTTPVLRVPQGTKTTSFKNFLQVLT